MMQRYWTFENYLVNERASMDISSQPHSVAVVRADDAKAELDRVMERAVAFAEITANPYSGSPEGTANWHQAVKFLNSPEVVAWKARQNTPPMMT